MSSRIADVKGTKESSAMLQVMQLLFSSIYIVQNKPAVVREKFVKIVAGLPGVPVTEELNFFEMNIQRINCFHRFRYFTDM